MMKTHISFVARTRHSPIFDGFATSRGTGAPGACPPFGAGQRIAALLQFIGNIFTLGLFPSIVVVVVTLSGSVSFASSAGFAAFAPG